jgi:hypothetical protein
MSKENNIDKLFRDQLKNDTAPYKPEYWAGMERLMDGVATGGFARFSRFLSFKNIAIFVGALAILTTAILLIPDKKENIVTEDENIINEDQTNNLSSEISPSKTNAENNTLTQDDVKLGKELPDTYSDINDNNINKNRTVDFQESLGINKQTTYQAENNNIMIDNESEAPSSDNNEGENSEPLEADLKKQTGLLASSYISLENFKIPEIQGDTNGDSDPLNNPTLNKLHLNMAVYGGANMFKAFNNQSASPSFNTSFVAGISFDLNLRNYFDLSFEPAYVLRAGNNLHQKSTEINYLYFKEVTTTEVVTEKLHFVHVPFYVNYDFGKNHKLKVGVFGSMLFGSEGTQTITKTVNNQTEITESKVTDYRKHLTDINYGLGVGYDVKLNHYFTAGIRYFQGFNDFVDDQVYLRDNNDLLQEFQLVIKVYLF